MRSVPSAEGIVGSVLQKKVFDMRDPSKMRGYSYAALRCIESVLRTRSSTKLTIDATKPLFSAAELRLLLVQAPPNQPIGTSMYLVNSES